MSSSGYYKQYVHTDITSPTDFIRGSNVGLPPGDYRLIVRTSELPAGSPAGAMPVVLRTEATGTVLARPAATPQPAPTPPAPATAPPHTPAPVVTPPPPVATPTQPPSTPAATTQGSAAASDATLSQSPSPSPSPTATATPPPRPTPAESPARALAVDPRSDRDGTSSIAVAALLVIGMAGVAIAGWGAWRLLRGPIGVVGGSSEEQAAAANPGK